MKISMLVFIVTVVLTGCASTGAVPIGRDTFMISKTNHAGAFGSINKLTAKLALEAHNHCRSLGKESQVVTTDGHQPIVGGLGGSTVTFKCLDTNDAAFSSPVLRPDNGVTTIEVR